MLKHLIFILPFLFLQACNKDEKAADVPPLLFPAKKSSSFTEPATLKAAWVTGPAPKNKARVVKTTFNNYTEPFFYINQFQPLIAPPDSLSFTLSDLPSKPFTFAGVKRKIFPRIIKLGTPVKTKALFPIVNDLATNGMMYLSTDQGLPSTVVAGTVQDKEGRLWMATEHGLCLYDGEFFYTWFKQNGISRDELRFIYKDKRDHLWIGGSGVDEIIPSEGIIKHYGKQQIGQGLISIKEDAKGRLLFGLVEGLQIFDPATDTLTYLGPESGITKAVVNTLIVDSKQRIWLALNGGGVNVIDPSINKIYYIDDKRGLSNNDIRDIMQDKNGNIWMGGWNGGVDYYDPESGKFYQLREKNGLCDRYIRCFNEDENGNIWIGCLSGGLDLYDPVKRKISHIYGKRGIVRSDCRSIFRDSFNRMWVSTNGSGILLYDATIGTKDNFNTKWRSAKTAVNTVLEDAEGNFWIGTGGLGMDLVNIKEKTLKHLMNEDWTDGWINRLYDDSIGNIWMTTDYRLDKLNKATSVVTSWGKDEGLPNEMVRSMSVCKNDIYLGTIGGLEKFIKGTETFAHLECKDYPLKNLISFMEFDKKGHLWMASYSDGVFELDTATLQLKHYGKQQGLNKVFIYSMTIDKTGNIWLGTGGDGLKIIDPVTKNITTLTVADGLCEMTVLSLHENNGRMYAGTVKGLSVINANGDHFEIDNYDKPQGFEATDFNQNSVMQATDGRIWWGIGEVLTIFKPTEKKNAQGKT
ncbi:MAG: two-component regulator propeller domain-containing protein, partial [Bacteroidia bacterium]